MNSAIADAVLAAGSQSALARAVGVSPQAVQQWVDSGRVSHRKVLDVERATGVSRTRLRPDVTPPTRPFQLLLMALLPLLLLMAQL